MKFQAIITTRKITRRKKQSILSEFPKLQTLLNNIKTEHAISQKQPTALEIAAYFKSALKRNGFTITQKHWQLSLDIAVDITSNSDYSHISIPEWKACIDWAFSPARYSHKFWGKVRVASLKTVVSMYDDYVLWRKQSAGKTGVEDYGNL
jgi:hypothetical protein